MNSTSGASFSKIILLVGMALLALFQLTTPKGPPQYFGYVGLHWNQLSNASTLSADETLPNSRATFFAQPSHNEGRTGVGTTGAFRIPGRTLRFEQAGRMPRTALLPSFTLTDVSGAELFEFHAPIKELSSREWTPFEVVVPPEIVGRDIQLAVKVKNNVDADAWYALRNRIDVFEAPNKFEMLGASGIKGLSESTASKLYNFNERYELINLFCLIAAAIGLFLIGSQIFRNTFSNLNLLLAFFIVAVLFHFRSSIFFYWDEWDIIWLFKQNLYSGIVRTHNEHFIPFFFSFYYLENLLFGEHYQLYLIVSYALHALNSVSLCLLLAALGGDSLFARRAAQLVAFCFLVNGVHPDNLHWVVQQVDLLCEGTVILALFAATRFMHKGRWKKLIQAGVAVFAAPFFFGNGLVAAPKVAALAVFAPLRLLHRQGEPDDSFKEWLTRAVKLIVCAGIAGAAAAMFYIQHPPANPPDGSALPSFAEFKRMINYNVTSTYLGAFLRVLGLFPYLDARAPQRIFGGTTFLGVEPELGLGRIGLGISILTLLVGLLLNGGYRYLRLWLLGAAVMFFSMILPSIGRSKYGLFQGLSLRYTYSTMVGVAIIVFALICVVHAWYEARTRRPNRIVIGFSYAYLLWLLSCSLFMSREERFFTDIGYANLTYRNQLIDWRNQDPNDGYAPTIPPNIVPGATSEKVIDVLQFLGSAEFEG